MMGKNHATSAAVTWLLFGGAAAATAGTVDMDPATFALGTLVAAGAGVAPDVDHPDSRAAKTFGPVGQVAAAGIGAAAGGHRQRTHTLLFVIAMTAVTHWAVGASGPWPATIVVALCVTLGIGLIGPSVGLPGAAGAAGLVLGAAAGWLVHSGTVEAGGWVTAAAAVGLCSHIVGDMMTPEGVKLLWPISSARLGLPVFTTGGLIERVVGVALLVVFVWLAATSFVPGLI